ncbi:MAG: phosphoribosylglycinamide formyltransferase [Deltaproteobacteria bacterium]|nr:phosphoribosylglycinamide formyltransferase [Deltaproteobacteria bacterium]
MSSSKKLPLGILASGRGSNLQSILDASQSGQLDAQVAVVISDNIHAQALDRARKMGIPAVVCERSHFASKEAFEQSIVKELHRHHVELVCLAGFMRLIGKTLLTAYPHKILNIHPALLPAFPGLSAQSQALDYGVKVAGCTVHIVDDRVDHGPIILQSAVEVRDDDTVDALSARILEEEHRIYPQAIQLFAENRVRMEGRHIKLRSKGET